MEHAATHSVIFGLDPRWFAGALFVLTYALVMSEKINRAVVAIFMAMLMILGGVLSQEAALAGVDFNTIGLLTGMMVVVGVTKHSGIFQYLAIWSAKRVNAHPWGILVMLSLVTAILSALLDNVTTVLLVVPVTLLITDALKLSPYPFLFAEIFSANIGGTATLIGDPPNIMIGSAVGLSFNDFLLNTAPVAVLLMALFLVPLYLIWGRRLHASEENRARVMRYQEKDAITDVGLLKKSLWVLAGIITGLMVGHDFGYQPATIALFGAALLLVLHGWGHTPSSQSEMLEKAFCDVEWTTLFFFLGLFVVVHGVESTGLLEAISDGVLHLTDGHRATTAIAIMWVAAVASALIDNIPFVATMIPVIESMATTFGSNEALLPIWWSLALGACLGGNGSLIGASANLVVVGFAERSGHPIRFLPFMAMAFPLMLMSILVSSVYVYLRYFWAIQG